MRAGRGDKEAQVAAFGNDARATSFSVIMFPLPVTLVYGDGTRTSHVVTVREADSTIVLPLRGALRTIEVNADGTVPVAVKH